MLHDFLPLRSNGDQNFSGPCNMQGLWGARARSLPPKFISGGGRLRKSALKDHESFVVHAVNHLISPRDPGHFQHVLIVFKVVVTEWATGLAKNADRWRRFAIIYEEMVTRSGAARSVRRDVSFKLPWAVIELDKAVLSAARSRLDGVLI